MVAAVASRVVAVAAVVFPGPPVAAAAFRAPRAAVIFRVRLVEVISRVHPEAAISPGLPPETSRDPRAAISSDRVVGAFPPIHRHAPQVATASPAVVRHNFLPAIVPVGVPTGLLNCPPRAQDPASLHARAINPRSGPAAAMPAIFLGSQVASPVAQPWRIAPASFRPSAREPEAAVFNVLQGRLSAPSSGRTGPIARRTGINNGSSAWIAAMSPGTTGSRKIRTG